MKKKKRMKGTGPDGIPFDYEALSTSLEVAIEVGLLTQTEASMVAQFAEDISNLVTYAKYYPDSLAAEQIQVIHKILRPHVYEMPPAVIKELAKKYQGVPAHNRAAAIRRIMWRIAHALESVRPDAKNILDGPVKPRPLADVEWRPGEQAALHAEVARFWKPNVTLQSLAIRIYLGELKDKKGVDAASLRADLRALAAWERKHTPKYGAAAEPTAPLWRLLSTREVPINLEKMIERKQLAEDEDEEGR